MIDELRKDAIEGILSETRGDDPLPRYEDRDRWERIARNPLIGATTESHLKAIETSLEKPLEHIPASLYLFYRRTGSRTPHDGLVASRRSKLMHMVLGECLERKGRFLDPIMDHIWAICEESSWVIPAHSAATLPVYKDIKWVDLVSANTALVLGETIHILGSLLDQHDPTIRERMLHEMERRIWRPYLEPSELRWLREHDGKPVNNWNAVCNCGVVGSALLCLSDTQVLPALVETCLSSLNDYLRSFGPDGGSSEGPSYWNYGFSHYAWLAYLLEKRTGRGIAPMDAPELRRIALFPQRVTLSGQSVVNFSDCAPQARFRTSLMYYLGDRLGLPEVSGFANYLHELDPPRGSLDLWDMAWMPDNAPGGSWKPNAHEYLSGLQWMVSRVDPGDPKCLMVAAKGGHNGENHNQNDVGNFLVHFGGETLIVDLGSGTYTRDYFGPGRYDILVNSSRGHNVPLVNGCEQSTGFRFAAQVLEHSSSHSRDTLELELAGAYPPEAGLGSLRRRVTLHRESGKATVDDAILFKEEDGRCECPLYTLGDVARRNGGLRFEGKTAALGVTFGPGIACKVEELDLRDGKFPESVRRAVLTIPVQGLKGEMHLEISASLD